MRYTATLEAINNGERQWALRFIDHETGKVVEGKISGGDSNIYGILRHWGKPDDWDRSVLWRITEMGKRDFHRLTESWVYLGCNPEELATNIRKALAVLKGPS